MSEANWPATEKRPETTDVTNLSLHNVPPCPYISLKHLYLPPDNPSLIRLKQKKQTTCILLHPSFVYRVEDRKSLAGNGGMYVWNGRIRFVVADSDHDDRLLHYLFARMLLRQTGIT